MFDMSSCPGFHVQLHHILEIPVAAVDDNPELRKVPGVRRAKHFPESDDVRVVALTQDGNLAQGTFGILCAAEDVGDALQGYIVSCSSVRTGEHAPVGPITCLRVDDVSIAQLARMV